MRELTGVVSAVSFVVWWFAGIVIAKGFSAFVATCFFPYAFYVVVERVMQVTGLI